MQQNDHLTNDLRTALELACQCQNAHNIVAGRNRVLSMPRDWVMLNIETIVVDQIDLSDCWEYRRLLELAELLDKELLHRLVLAGLNHIDPEIREAAEDFNVIEPQK